MKRWRKYAATPEFAVRFHTWRSAIWAASLIPTLLWLRDSVLWVAFLSIAALVETAWGARQAALADLRVKRSV